MKTIAIEVQRREQTGKGAARSARREGVIPGVLYGQGQSISINIDRRDFVKKLHEARGENVIWDVIVPGAEPMKSLAREIQHHPVSRSMMHVDFQHIDLSQRIEVRVTVHLNGEPEGVRNFGGILEHVARDLDVSCLPINIPASIEVDVSQMMIGDIIHLSDLPTTDFEFVGDPHKVIAHVAAPTVEAAPTAEEAAAALAVAAPAAGDAKEEGADAS